MHKHFFKLMGFFCLLWISGCATNTIVKPIPEKIKNKLWHQRLYNLNQKNSWKVLGRIGFQFPKKSGFTSIQWQQKNQNFSIYLESLLGLSIANIHKKNGYSILEFNKKKYTGTSTEKLLKSVTGWQLPINHLSFWILGMPALNQPYQSKQLDNTGQIQKLTQSGWTIQYLQYKQLKPVSLPSRIKITKDDIKITFILKQWIKQ